MDLEALKFPVGVFTIPESVSEENISDYINTIASFPKWVYEEVKDLSKEELNYKYRQEGWSIQQVVNHCIDSHMNGIFRFKLALTEDNPTIRPYKENLWAELSDTLEYDIEDSVNLLHHVHTRWVFLMKEMSSNDFNKTFYHPESNETFSLRDYLSLYDWHCRNHLGQNIEVIF